MKRKYVELMQASVNSPVLINPDLVSAIVSFKEEETLIFVGGEKFRVKHSLEKVKELLEEG